MAKGVLGRERLICAKILGGLKRDGVTLTRWKPIRGPLLPIFSQEKCSSLLFYQRDTELCSLGSNMR